jgi:RNA polymerase-binding transcription factor DksA
MSTATMTVMTMSKTTSETAKFCIDCGEEIPAKRLAAVPDAIFCVQCQPHRLKIRPEAFACNSEGDDSTRKVEAGWYQPTIGEQVGKPLPMKKEKEE